MIVYKLTDKDGYCRRNNFGETLYEVGKTYTSDGNGRLCTEHWRHAYEHPILAVLHDPAHGKYGDSARMWECDTLDGTVKKNGMLKLGTTKLKVLREIDKPQVTLEQCIAYALSCSLRVYAEESYVKWAEGWLSRKDRSRESASTAMDMVVRMAGAAARRAAARAAWNTAYAAEDASAVTVWGAEYVVAYGAAAFAAEDAAGAYAAGAYADASAAEDAAAIAVSTKTLDLLGCAREVFLIE